MNYFKLKGKILAKSKGVYIMPSIFLLLEIGIIVLLDLLVSKEFIIRENLFLTTILPMTAIITCSLLVAYIIYLVQLLYYEDRSNGIQFLMYSKPISRRKIFFSNLLAISVPAFILMLSFWILNAILFVTFVPKISHLNAYIFSALLFAILVTLTFLSFTYLICTKVNKKIFSFIAITPLLLNSLVSLVVIADNFNYRKNFNEVSKRINSNQILPIQFNSDGSLNINNLNSEWNNRKLKDIPSLQEYNSYSTNSFVPTLDINKKDKSLIWPYFSWLDYQQHAKNINELLTNSNTTNWKWKTKFSYTKLDSNKYMTFNAKNYNDEDKEFVFSQINAYSKNEFKNNVKQLISNILTKSSSYANASIIKNMLLQSTNYLQNINSYNDIYNSTEFKKLIQEAWEKIQPSFATFTSEFTDTYNKIKELLIGKYGEAFTNKTIEQTMYNSQIYQNNPSMINTLTPHALSLLMTTKYYSLNKSKLNKIDIKPAKLLANSPDDKSKTYEFSGNLALKNADRLPSLIDYSIVENTSDSFVSMTKYVSYPNWISILYFIILLAIMLPIAYKLHVKGNFK